LPDRIKSYLAEQWEARRRYRSTMVLQEESLQLTQQILDPRTDANERPRLEGRMREIQDEINKINGLTKN